MLRRAEQTEARAVYELLRLPFDCQLANTAFVSCHTYVYVYVYMQFVYSGNVRSLRYNNFI